MAFPLPLYISLSFSSILVVTCVRYVVIIFHVVDSSERVNNGRDVRFLLAVTLVCKDVERWLSK